MPHQLMTGAFLCIKGAVSMRYMVGNAYCTPANNQRRVMKVDYSSILVFILHLRAKGFIHACRTNHHGSCIFSPIPFFSVQHKHLTEEEESNTEIEQQQPQKHSLTIPSAQRNSPGCLWHVLSTFQEKNINIMPMLLSRKSFRTLQFSEPIFKYKCKYH